MRKLRFTCPKCGEDNTLEGVAPPIVVFWRVDGACEHVASLVFESASDATEAPETFDFFQCTACGYTLLMPDGTLAQTQEEVVAWLQQRGMLHDES